jgi:hypothetical protein
VTSDSTYNGRTVRGTSTVTSGDNTATMTVSFFTEVDNPYGLEVGYPDPSVVCTAINAYAKQLGWAEFTFGVDQPTSVTYGSGANEEALRSALGDG